MVLSAPLSETLGGGGVKGVWQMKRTIEHVVIIKFIVV